MKLSSAPLITYRFCIVNFPRISFSSKVHIYAMIIKWENHVFIILLLYRERLYIDDISI